MSTDVYRCLPSYGIHYHIKHSYSKKFGHIKQARILKQVSHIKLAHIPKNVGHIKGQWFGKNNVV